MISEHTPPASLRVILTPEQADALAQFCKHVFFIAIEDVVGNVSEAYLVRDSFDVIRASLARCGYVPR